MTMNPAESLTPTRPLALSLADAGKLPAALIDDLRTDHAGETGAVMIYRGILAIARDPGLRHFAQHHRATEALHLARIEPLLTRRQRSLLLPLWRIAGWLTGALPALLGPRAVYATIEAVETFVDQHYAEQIESIDRLDPGRLHASLQAVRALLQECRSDEIAHRDEAALLFSHSAQARGPGLRLWVALVGSGSRGAVSICRHL
jgi:ubiquinone biosynthesis monooxygenase Coq7